MKMCALIVSMSRRANCWDTHTLLWAMAQPSLLSRKAARIIADPDNIIFVSAASAWEIATKVRLGKLPGAAEIERDFLDLMHQAGYTMLSISVRSALRAGCLSGHHWDPFDRMIAAQAMAADICVLSKDVQLDIFGIRRIW